jgi:hypothetical protein
MNDGIAALARWPVPLNGTPELGRGEQSHCVPSIVAESVYSRRIPRAGKWQRQRRTGGGVTVRLSRGFLKLENEPPIARAQL